LNRMFSNRISPRSTLSSRASVLSVTECGRAMVLMPSWTVPMFSNNPAISQSTHSDIDRIRMTKAMATAIAPSVIADRYHA